MRSSIIIVVIGIALVAGMMNGAAERQPASDSSIVTQISIPKKITPSKLNSETYRFERKLKATLNQGEVLSDLQYQGRLMIYWLNPEDQIKTGIFKFSINGSSVPEVQMKVTMNQDHQWIKLEESEQISENEESAMIFLKDLVSIYAFKSLEDTNGKYHAQIKLIRDEQGNEVWFKKKLGNQFKKSIHEIKTNKELISATGMEVMEINGLISNSYYQLVKEDDLVDDRFNLDLAYKNCEMKVVIKPINFEKVSWSALMEKLQKMNELQSSDQLAFIHDLLIGLQSKPERLNDFLDWLYKNENNERSYTIGVGVLASLKTTQSQHELIQMLEKSESLNRSHLILNAIATSKMKLSNESKDYLNSLLESKQENPDLSYNAAFALGASGEVKKILELAEQTTSLTEKKLYLDAIGNSGSSDSISFLMEQLNSSDSSIREKAIFALRFVDDERVKPLFEKYIHDSSKEVQYSVIRAISFQSNQTQYISLLKSCIQSNVDKVLADLCQSVASDI